jgi:Lactonase, 7-bladed beta-propeller
VVTPSDDVAYVANRFSGDITAYKIDPATGFLSELPDSPYPSGEKPLAIAIHPSGQYAYVANRRSDVQAHRIDGSGGGLSPVAGSPFPAGKGPTAIVMHPSGNFVYVANFKSDNVGAYRVDHCNGALLQIDGSPFVSGGIPIGIAADPPAIFCLSPTVDPTTSPCSTSIRRPAPCRRFRIRRFPCHAGSRSILPDHLFISGIGPRMTSAVTGWRGRRAGFCLFEISPL